MRLRKTIGLSLAFLVASAPAMAKQAQTAHHEPSPHLKAKAGNAEPAAARGAAKQRRGQKAIAHAHSHAARTVRRHDREARQHAAGLPAPDQYIGPFKVIGKREVGSAAWYGGRHVGLRTASGERLDDVHVTAAHRSLPLYSLVRVTNLNNGRSVIATINDRGPVSHSLLIDVSPRAAEELHMVHTGIATVAIEPVVPVATAPVTAR